jgi:hypothetical protein
MGAIDEILQDIIDGGIEGLGDDKGDSFYRRLQAQAATEKTKKLKAEEETKETLVLPLDDGNTNTNSTSTTCNFGSETNDTKETTTNDFHYKNLEEAFQDILKEFDTCSDEELSKFIFQVSDGEYKYEIKESPNEARAAFFQTLKYSKVGTIFGIEKTPLSPISFTNNMIVKHKAKDLRKRVRETFQVGSLIDLIRDKVAMAQTSDRYIPDLVQGVPEQRDKEFSVQSDKDFVLVVSGES